MSWLMRKEERGWSVGYFAPDGQWVATQSGLTGEEAGDVVHYLNGGN